MVFRKEKLLIYVDIHIIHIYEELFPGAISLNLALTLETLFCVLMGGYRILEKGSSNVCSVEQTGFF